METPVLYFYPDRAMNVSVRVDFPHGRITEWYPSAQMVGSSIDWGRFAVVRTRTIFHEWVKTALHTSRHTETLDQ